MKELNVCGISLAQMTDEALEAVIEAAQKEKKDRRRARAKELLNKLINVFDEIEEAGFNVTNNWDTIYASNLRIDDDEEEEDE